MASALPHKLPFQFSSAAALSELVSEMLLEVLRSSTGIYDSDFVFAPRASGNCWDKPIAESMASALLDHAFSTQDQTNAHRPAYKL